VQLVCVDFDQEVDLVDKQGDPVTSLTFRVKYEEMV
jgi:hypothetical protein